MIDLIWSIRSHAVHEHHQYALYSALKHHLPEVASHPDMQVCALSGGRHIKPDLYYRPKTWRLRGPLAVVMQTLSLQGERLIVGDHVIGLEAAVAHELRPSSVLHARLVTYSSFRGGSGRSGFSVDRAAESVGRDLAELGIVGAITIGSVGRIGVNAASSQPGVPVTVHGLTDAASLLLQERGLGARRHMGCGVFVSDQQHGRTRPEGRASR